MDLSEISLVKRVSMTLLKIMSRRQQNIVILHQVWVLFYDLWQQLLNSIIGFNAKNSDKYKLFTRSDN